MKAIALATRRNPAVFNTTKKRYEWGKGEFTVFHWAKIPGGHERCDPDMTNAFFGGLLTLQDMQHLVDRLNNYKDLYPNDSRLTDEQRDELRGNLCCGGCCTSSWQQKAGAACTGLAALGLALVVIWVILNKPAAALWIAGVSIVGLGVAVALMWVSCNQDIRLVEEPHQRHMILLAENNILEKRGLRLAYLTPEEDVIEAVSATEEQRSTLAVCLYVTNEGKVRLQENGDKIAEKLKASPKLSVPKVCQSCHARLPHHDARHCTHCGASVVVGGGAVLSSALSYSMSYEATSLSESSQATGDFSRSYSISSVDVMTESSST